MIKKSRKLNVVCIAVLLAIFSACSNDNTNSEARQGKKIDSVQSENAVDRHIDVCSLLKQDEARTILGGPVKIGSSSSVMCQYHLEALPESITINFHSGIAKDFDRYIAKFERDFHLQSKPVTGVGDKAVFAGNSLIVKNKNDVLIILLEKKMKEEEQILQEKEIAMKAIGRIQE